MKKRREFISTVIALPPQEWNGKRCSICACGTGYGVRVLCEQGHAAQVIGVDIAPASVDYARRHHGVGSAVYLCASADRLPLADGTVDVVTSFETIEHVPDDHSLIEEFHRVLRPNGHLIVSTPNQWPLKDTPFHVREYTAIPSLRCWHRASIVVNSTTRTPVGIRRSIIGQARGDRSYHA
jgi:2-polyprenyl-3-methyl-5-hydroxy-6-metoxy-1,4-benzoquinol methylase